MTKPEQGQRGRAPGPGLVSMLLLIALVGLCVGLVQGTPSAIRLLVERINSDETLRVVFLDRRWPLE